MYVKSCSLCCHTEGPSCISPSFAFLSFGHFILGCGEWDWTWGLDMLDKHPTTELTSPPFLLSSCKIYSYFLLLLIRIKSDLSVGVALRQRRIWEALPPQQFENNSCIPCSSTGWKGSVGLCFWSFFLSLANIPSSIMTSRRRRVNRKGRQQRGWERELCLAANRLSRCSACGQSHGYGGGFAINWHVFPPLALPYFASVVWVVG